MHLGAVKTLHLIGSTSDGAWGSCLWAQLLFYPWRLINVWPTITNPITPVPWNIRQRERFHCAGCCIKPRDDISCKRTCYRSIKQEITKQCKSTWKQRVTHTTGKVEVSAKQQLNHYLAELAIYRFFLFHFCLAVTLRKYSFFFCTIVFFFFFSLPVSSSDNPAEVKDRVNKSDPSLKILPFCKADWVWITKLRISLICELAWKEKRFKLFTRLHTLFSKTL